jgi:hypothetical protein
LVRQFGDYYGFDEAELLSYVLHDEGTISISTFKPLGYEILEKYDPEATSLGTWAARLVRQNNELKRCLKEHGLLLKSDWGLLNETKPRQLQRILVEYFDEVETVVRQAVWAHEAYHLVYLPDRATKKGQDCKEPTPEQLQRMIGHIQQTFNQAMSIEKVMSLLQWSAKQLRQYRLKQQPKSYRPTEVTSRNEGDREVNDFLNGYQQQILQCLEQSIETVITKRIQGTSRAPRVATIENFLEALRFYYCEGISQGEIAERLKLGGQDRVNKLLKLTQLRAEIKLHTFPCLQNYIQAVVDAGDNPNKLLAIDAALNEQLDQLIQQDQEWGYTATVHLQQEGSLLSYHICAYLDRRSRC